MARLSPKNNRALVIAVIIAVIFGAYFFRHFFTAIAFAAITVYLFSPVYDWFSRRVKHNSSAASLTLLVTILSVLIPASIIIILTVLQINHLINELQTSKQLDTSNLSGTILNGINHILARIPGAHTITAAQLSDAVYKAATALAKGLFNIIVSSAGSISSFITSVIIYIYVFLSLLVNKQALINTIRQLNPLGPDMTDLYIEKSGAMTGAMVRGQFVIALCQGFVEALILQIAGLHGIFFFMFVLLTILSIIPLGGGIVAIPIGIIMLLLGDTWQGLFVLVGHFAIVTNIDNVLRPKLVPRSVRLNPALIMLAVFSGIAMFGFLGIVIGPIIVIMLKLTIEAYLDVVTASQKKLARRRPSAAR